MPTFERRGLAQCLDDGVVDRMRDHDIAGSGWLRRHEREHRADEQALVEHVRPARRDSRERFDDSSPECPCDLVGYTSREGRRSDLIGIDIAAVIDDVDKRIRNDRPFEHRPELREVRVHRIVEQPEHELLADGHAGDRRGERDRVEDLQYPREHGLHVHLDVQPGRYVVVAVRRRLVARGELGVDLHRGAERRSVCEEPLPGVPRGWGALCLGGRSLPMRVSGPGGRRTDRGRGS